MSESETRSAELQDVEPDDFVRFLEYAYRRDYTVPAWVLEEPNQTLSEDVGGPKKMSDLVLNSSHMSEAEAGAAPQVEDGWVPATTAVENGWNQAEQVVTADDEWVPKYAKKKTAKKRTRDITTLRSIFESHSYIKAGAPDVDLLERCKPKRNSAANQNFTSIFLAHARLYNFADMRLINPLKKLVLHKLHATLLVFKLL